MYEIRTLDGSTVLGSLDLEPFEFEPTEAGQDLADRLEGIDEAPVMNTAAPPKGGNEATSAEAWEDPHRNVVKQRVALIIQAEGLKAVKVDNAQG